MDPITPDQEALYARMIYFYIACGGIITLLILLLLDWIRREKKRQFERKDFILDRVSNSARELNLLIEEIWQKTQNQDRQ